METSIKRTVELAEKLARKENRRLLERWPKILEDSAGWAKRLIERHGLTEALPSVEAHRHLYCMNHICPSLYHVYGKPNPELARKDPEYYNDLLRKHIMENAQGTFLGRANEVVQEGVIHDTDNFSALVETANRIYMQVFGAEKAREEGLA